MNKQSNAYIIIYATVLVVVVASVLSFVSLQLKPLQLRNMEIEKKSDILQSVGLLTAPEGDYNAGIEAQYEKYITNSYLVNSSGDIVSDDPTATFEALVNLKKVFAADAKDRKMPIFVSTSDSGVVRYIFPVDGVGLWGTIWGFVALAEDFNTISGVVFAHVSETPGLGAEIATPIFEDRFIDKKLFDGNTYKGISVLKGEGASAGNDNAVDAISGGTITSVAVEEMLVDCMTNGYRSFIEKMKKENEPVVEVEVIEQLPEQLEPVEVKPVVRTRAAVKPVAETVAKKVEQEHILEPVSKPVADRAIKPVANQDSVKVQTPMQDTLKAVKIVKQDTVKVMPKAVSQTVDTVSNQSESL